MKLWQGCITDLHCFPRETDGKIQTQTNPNIKPLLLTKWDMSTDHLLPKSVEER